MAKSQLPDRRRFDHSRLTTVSEGLGGGTCRVCGEAIEHGEEVRSRAWGVERAHARCGWFREGEGLAPTERRTGGSFRTFLEWRCAECGLDAVADYARQVPEDRRCGRCEVVRCGELAVLRVGVSIGKGPGIKRVPEGHVVRVRELEQVSAEEPLLALVESGGARWRMRAVSLRRVIA